MGDVIVPNESMVETVNAGIFAIFLRLLRTPQVIPVSLKLLNEQILALKIMAERIRVGIAPRMPYVSGCLPNDYTTGNRNIQPCGGARAGLGTEIFLLVSKFLKLELEFVLVSKKGGGSEVFNTVKNCTLDSAALLYGETTAQRQFVDYASPIFYHHKVYIVKKLNTDLPDLTFLMFQPFSMSVWLVFGLSILCCVNTMYFTRKCILASNILKPFVLVFMFLGMSFYSVLILSKLMAIFKSYRPFTNTRGMVDLLDSGEYRFLTYYRPADSFFG